MIKFELQESRYNAAETKPSWNIINIKTGEIVAKFYYKLPARDRLSVKKAAEDYMKNLVKE